MDLNFDSPIFIIDGIAGLAIFLVGLLGKFFPPKNINILYGYRTKRSMKNELNWKFAQLYSNQLTLRYGIIIMAFGVFGLFTNFTEWVSVSSALIAIFGCMAYMIYQTENALKDFEKDEKDY